MLSELTLTVMRLGLLVLLWVFVFAVVGVLRGDLYGTRVKRRPAGAGAAAASPPRSPHRDTGDCCAARRPSTPPTPARPEGASDAAVTSWKILRENRSSPSQATLVKAV